MASAWKPLAHRAQGGQLCVPIPFASHATRSLELTWISKEETEPKLSTRHLPPFAAPPIALVNERVWGVLHHQANSYLTRCSQHVHSRLQLGTRGVPDLAEACAGGQ